MRTSVVLALFAVSVANTGCMEACSPAADDGSLDSPAAIKADLATLKASLAAEAGDGTPEAVLGMSGHWIGQRLTGAIDRLDVDPLVVKFAGAQASASPQIAFSDVKTAERACDGCLPLDLIGDGRVLLKAGPAKARVPFDVVVKTSAIVEDQDGTIVARVVQVDDVEVSAHRKSGKGKARVDVGKPLERWLKERVATATQAVPLFRLEDATVRMAADGAWLEQDQKAGGIGAAALPTIPPTGWVSAVDPDGWLAYGQRHALAADEDEVIAPLRWEGDSLVCRYWHVAEPVFYQDFAVKVTPWPPAPTSATMSAGTEGQLAVDAVSLLTDGAFSGIRTSLEEMLPDEPGSMSLTSGAFVAMGAGPAAQVALLDGGDAPELEVKKAAPPTGSKPSKKKKKRKKKK